MRETDADSSLKTDNTRVPWWLWPNVLALDAPFVAVTWLYFFAGVLDIHLFPHIYWILGLTVWLIYTSDHLWDGLRLKNRETATHRHLFAAENPRFLTVLLVLGLGLLVYLLLFKAEAVLTMHFEGGRIAIPPYPFFLLLMVAGYFVGRVRSIEGFPKEVLCGTIFALGVLCPVTVLTNWILPQRDAGLAGNLLEVLKPEIWLFAFLCSINCLAISCWEFDADQENDPESARRHDQHQRWPGLAIFVIVVSLLVVFLEPTLSTRIVCAAIAVSGSLLVAIQKFGSRLSPPLKRTLADFALLTPWTFVLFLA
ncbi:MAG: hypothetical protein AAGJ79_07165 [Verrucomicrobiota bacterium]